MIFYTSLFFQQFVHENFSFIGDHELEVLLFCLCSTDFVFDNSMKKSRIIRRPAMVNAQYSMVNTYGEIH